ncbi:MAG TPA: sialate O-acetylesterase [Opitutaceae bacterium]
MKLRNLASCFLFTLSALRADVALAPLFQDHAVLQQGKPVPVWGRADAGEKVTVTFAGQTAHATADADGRWILYLDTLPANATPAELVATGRNTVIVRDVLVGEVWLCSGQSNMEWPVSRAQNAKEEIATASFPLIRHFKVKRTVADAPQENVEGAWAVCSPETAAHFTAVGYFFARDLHRKLGVPVGLVNSSWGGTPVESWMSPAALHSEPAFAVVRERWQKTLDEYPAKKAGFDEKVAAWEQKEAAARVAGEAALAEFRQQNPRPWGLRGAPGDSWTPMGLYNAMINPLVPYALRGALWYQGESNAGHASEYHALFAAMITWWRAHFGQGDFPFYWVQLANYKAGNGDGTDWAFLREAQTQTLSLPNTGQALAIDIGNPDDIHPTNKQEVGRRLALIAKTRIYEVPGDFSGPQFVSATPEGAAMRVRFNYADNGLTAGAKPLQSFVIAGADRKFYPATARIERDTVVVSAPEVKEPVAVRYAWSNSPEANLFNGAGLPACPFRSDSW